MSEWRLIKPAKAGQKCAKKKRSCQKSRTALIGDKRTTFHFWKIKVANSKKLFCSSFCLAVGATTLQIPLPIKAPVIWREKNRTPSRAALSSNLPPPSAPGSQQNPSIRKSPPSSHWTVLLISAPQCLGIWGKEIWGRSIVFWYCVYFPNYFHHQRKIPKKFIFLSNSKH